MTSVQSTSSHKNDGYWTDEELAAVQLFKDYPDGLLLFADVFLILLMFFGIPANTTTIIALARYKKIHSATVYFIINLSIVDLLSCCINLPLTVSSFWYKSWNYGRTLCWMFALARYTTVGAMLLSIVAITITRCIIIVHPRLYPRIYTKKNVALMIISIWILPLAALLPVILNMWGHFGLDPNIGFCSIICYEKKFNIKKIIFAVLFTITLLVIVICYIRIIGTVKESKRKTRARKKASDNENAPAAPPNRASLAPPPLLYGATRRPEQSSSPVGHMLDGHDAESTIEADRKSQAAVALQCSPALTKSPRLKYKNTKLTNYLLIIILSFIIGVIPMGIIEVFFEHTSHPVVNITAYMLFYSTTNINPLVYVVMSPEYRQAYKNLLTCRRRR